MPRVFAVLGGDRRQTYLAEELERIGYEREVFAVPGLPDSGTLSQVLHRADCVILPMPAFDREGNLRTGDGRRISPAEIAASLPENARVFGGKLPKGSLPDAEDYAEWEPLAIANAAVTAEGAIRLAMEQLPVTVQGGRFLITGAGRIGMALASRLRLLGAEVTVTARKERDLARIRACGLTADLTGRYGLGLRPYDCVLNTVPVQVFTAEQMRHLRPDCVCIELASSPGGFPPGAKSINGGGLPGKTSPKTAGVLILDAILQHLRQEERSGKDV